MARRKDTALHGASRRDAAELLPYLEEFIGNEAPMIDDEASQRPL